MKNFKHLTILALAATVAGAQAQIASDNAANAVYTGGNIDGLNGGYGFGPWTATPNTNSGVAGNFQFTSSQNGNGASGNIDTSGLSWGMYGNSGNTSTLFRPIAVAMTGVRVVSLDWDNGWIDQGQTVSVQIGAYKFGFTGGAANYWYDIGGGQIDSGLPFTTDGLFIKLALNGTGGYHFSASPYATSSVWATANFVGAQIPAFIQATHGNAGFGASNNSYINNLKILAPEPGSFVALGAATCLLLIKRRSRR